MPNFGSRARRNARPGHGTDEKRGRRYLRSLRTAYLERPRCEGDLTIRTADVCQRNDDVEPWCASD